MDKKGYKFWSPMNDTFHVPNTESKCTWHLGIDPDLNPHTEQTRRPKTKLLPDVLAAIGDTPLIKLNKIPQAEGLKCEVYAKCEYFNPAGSVKDRMALRIVEDAEKQGLLKPGGTIIEPTSGNTGVALALVGAIKGYKVISVMPELMSLEKAVVQEVLGTKIVRTPNDAGLFSPDGIMGVAHRLKKEIPNSIILDQFSNPGNGMTHYDTTVQEILDQCDGKVDMIVMCSGSGGTITGIARRLKEMSLQTKIIGVDPIGFVLPKPDTFSEVEGIGYFVPTVLDKSLVDQWVKPADKDSMLMARRLIHEEGLLCGGSAGAALAAAIEVGKNLDADQRIVVILPDNVRNYLTKFVTDQWMEARGFMPCINNNKYGWWDNSLMELNLLKPLPVPRSTSCEEALSLMKKYGIEQLPVEGSNGVMTGILTLQNLMSGLISKKLKLSEDIKKCNIIQIFPKIYKASGTLGLVSRILEKEPYVVVLERDEADNNKFIGIITPMILLEYTNTHAD